MVEVSLAEAARRLGISTEAVRKRILRGTLAGHRRGRQWVVLLPETEAQPPSGQDNNQHNNRPDALQQPDTTAMAVYEQLVEALQDRIASQERRIEALEQQVADWADESRRKDLMIARLEDRVMELPSGAPGSDESHEDRRDEQGPGYVYRPPEAAGRPWWQWWRRDPR
jgi:hypothetical protein